ncbi:MAG TPA: aminotransferase class V-fold PLP-dependent enzyme, partial [Anaerolineae bacterium]|nr:aminotransferase class V-fold PLP-dependent enzyme [Anaerolineae bacterium]
LAFDVVTAEYGEPFDWAAVERALKPGAGWLWAVHCETSTGILNDLGQLKAICQRRGVKLCMDCISSIGTVPVDLSGVHLATGVSGKGLGAFPGLALVFHQEDVKPSPKRLPRYLDIGLYAHSEGIPFTHSSNLVYALYEGAKRLAADPPFARIAELSNWLREELAKLGIGILAPAELSSPAVLTLLLPEGVDSVKMGDRLEREGYLLSYMSAYLRQRNWVQICLMGECCKESIAPMLDTMRLCCRQAQAVG